MREIKFRGKSIADIDRGEWVYGYLFNVEGEVAYIWNGVPHEVAADTVGQYTGLKDRDGKEIYEGDLLLSVEMVWKVVYDENLASFVLCTEYGRGSTPLGEMIRSFDFKISGNIHDNPELLEEVK